MFDAGTLRLLIETFQQSGAGKVINTPEPEGYYSVQSPSGGITVVEAKPSHRRHTAFDLTAVVEFAKRYSDEASIWYSRNGVVCITDDTGDFARRMNRVTLPLLPSVPMSVLQSWEKNTIQLQQEQAVRLMRTTFADCLASAGNLATILANVRFTVNKEQQGEIRQGRSSLGSNLTAQIDGYDKIPDTVTFSVPVFAAGVIHEAPVRCALETYPASGGFAFVPIPGQIESAFWSAEAWIVEQLRAAMNDPDARIYYGNP